VHSVECIYLRQRCFNASKPCVAALTGTQYQYVGFSWHNKIPCCSAYAIAESNPIPASGLWSRSDRAQKLIRSSMSWHLSTRKMSSKSMHAFLSNLANRQTDKHRGQSDLPPPSSEVIITSSAMVLPPGEYNDMILEWLFIYSKVSRWDCNCFLWCFNANNNSPAISEPGDSDVSKENVHLYNTT